MTIVFCTEKKRPGCVLLQVAMGGTVPTQRFYDLFPPDTWLVAPTDAMKSYVVTDTQLEQLSEMAMNAVILEATP